jgi:hypothetical protein
VVLAGSGMDANADSFGSIKYKDDELRTTDKQC